MKQIKLKDNSAYTRDCLTGVSNLADKITNKSLKQLENDGIFVFSDNIKASEDISDNQFILNYADGKYNTGNLMGFIGYRNEYITISSRFSDDSQDYLLKYLVDKVLNIPTLLNFNTTFDKNARILDFYMFLFPEYLKAAMRKGVYKSYVLKEYNDANVKGVIDIKKHMQLNTPFLGKIAYKQKEFTYDNYITQLIRHTIEFLKSKPDFNFFVGKVRDEIEAIVNNTRSYKPGSRRKVVEQNRKNRVKHAYFHEYQKLQTLCLLILNHEKCMIGSGINEIYGVVFDGAWLWEEYVNMLIGDYFYHPKNKTARGGQRLFDKNAGHIYPDFISKDATSRVIADAKYKPLRNIRSGDYLQVVAYMYRFDAKRGLYLYPESMCSENQKLRPNRGVSFENNVCPREDVYLEKIGLALPDNASDYEQYRCLIQQAENDFVKKVITLL